MRRELAFTHFFFCFWPRACKIVSPWKALYVSDCSMLSIPLLKILKTVIFFLAWLFFFFFYCLSILNSCFYKHLYFSSVISPQMSQGSGLTSKHYDAPEELSIVSRVHSHWIVLTGYQDGIEGFSWKTWVGPVVPLPSWGILHNSNDVYRIGDTGFPDGASDKESTCWCRRHERCALDPWVWKIAWRRKWQPTPVFLPGESRRQMSLVGYSPWGHKESDTTEWLNTGDVYIRD